MAPATAPPEYLLGDAADERARLLTLAALLEDTLVAGVDRHPADPGTVVIRALTVQAWGREGGRS